MNEATSKRRLRTGNVMIVLALIAIGFSGFAVTFVRVNSVRYCRAIENVKSDLREGAQATIDGDNLLLKAHDGPQHAALPVPRQAVVDDIAAKQKTVDRFPPRECGYW